MLGCVQNNETYLISNTYNTEIKIKDTLSFISIPIDSLSELSYQKNFVLKEGKIEYLYGFNPRRHSFDVFDLNNKKFIKHIKLNRDGPNSISRVYKFLVHSSDSIIIMDALSLKIINGNGEVKNKISLDIEGIPNIPDGHFLNYNDASLIYFPEREELIAHFIPKSLLGKIGNYEDAPLLGSINLETEKVKIFPVSYSKLIVDRKGKVDERMPNISYANGNIIYGFPVESNIYTYDLAKDTFEEFGGKSKFSDNIENFDRKEEETFRHTGTWFNSVNYDERNNIFYRTHWGSQDLKLDDMTYSTSYTKPGYVMFFDLDFNVIEEVKIDDKLWLESSFKYSEGIGFWVKDKYLEDEDILKIGLYEYEVEQK